MKVDPTASMQVWAVTVELGGREFELPAMPAAEWWPVLTEPHAGHLIDLLMSGPDDPLSLMLLAGEVTLDDLEQGLRDVLSEVTGRPFHTSIVLAATANHFWSSIGGDLARQGFRWDIMPIGAALDAVYSRVVEGMSDADRNKFETMLENESLSDPGKKQAPSERVVAEFETMAGPRPEPAPVPGKSSDAPSDGARSRTRTRPRPPRPGGRSSVPRQRPGQPG